VCPPAARALGIVGCVILAAGCPALPGGPTGDAYDPFVLRTDFSDPAAWAAVRAAVVAPVGPFGYRAHVRFADAPQEAGAAPATIAARQPADGPGVVFVADRTTMTHPEHPLLVVDLRDRPGRVFRAVPAQM
jgi:hypothetical protein